MEVHAKCKGSAIVRIDREQIVRESIILIVATLILEVLIAV